MARHLQDLADELRVLPGMTNVPITQQRALLAQCRALWDKRAWIMDTLEAPAHADAARALMDIALFAADFEVKIASAGDMVAARQEGLRLLDEARISLGPSAVLEHECRAFRQALGITVLNNAPAPAPRTMWEHTALGRAYLASGDLPRAEQELTTALALAPGDRWPNFYYGLCAHRLGRHEDAVLAFSVTIGAAPVAAGCYFNRAVAQAALGRTDLALKDYDHALRLDPSLMPALQNRGLLHLAAKRWPAAIADFQQALLQGADPATMHYSLALAHQAAGSRARALEAVEQALRHNPDHEAARKLRQSLTSHPTNRAGPHQSQVRSLPGDCV
jgi:tetratricopeptide (TPR) repeat protein